MNAILFSKDGTTRVVQDVDVSTYLNTPIYVAPGVFTKWHVNGIVPDRLTHLVDRQRRYIKQIESDDYAVFTEE